MWKNEYEIFNTLNSRLAEHNLNLEVVCLGGFVLSHNGMRSTQDIDGFFETNSLIDSLIDEVGKKYNINTLDKSWLNNSVQNMNEKPDIHLCELLYDFSNLKVYLAPLNYIAGMKLISCREQDIIDVAEIIKKQSVSNPNELKAILKKYGFNLIDESIILEAFGKAYGIKWLKQYFIAHENEILKNL